MNRLALSALAPGVHNRGWYPQFHDREEYLVCAGLWRISRDDHFGDRRP